MTKILIEKETNVVLAMNDFMRFIKAGDQVLVGDDSVEYEQSDPNVPYYVWGLWLEITEGEFTWEGEYEPGKYTLIDWVWAISDTYQTQEEADAILAQSGGE